MTKPILHILQVETLFRCGEQYRRRYIAGQIPPFGRAFITGRPLRRIFNVKKFFFHKETTHGHRKEIDEGKSPP